MMAPGRNGWYVTFASARCLVDRFEYEREAMDYKWGGFIARVAFPGGERLINHTWEQRN
jgi:hypothetical protein